MKIELLQSVYLLGTSIKLQKGKIYSASIANNLPDFRQKGLIFAHEKEIDPIGVLLESSEYQIIIP